MSAERNLSENDYELLSAYIDGELTDSERATLERRLAADDLLRDELEQLYRTVQWINQMPTLRAPRNFTLNAAMIEAADAQAKIVPMPMPRPARRVASFNYAGIAAAVAVVLFAGVLVLAMLGPSIGDVFSDISSALQPDNAAHSVDGVAVAQNPTPPTEDITPTDPLAQPEPNGRSVGEESVTTLGESADDSAQVDTQSGAAQPPGAAPPPAPATNETSQQDALGSTDAVDGAVAMDADAGVDEAESDQTNADTDVAGVTSLAPPSTVNESQPAAVGGAGGGMPNTGGGNVGGQADDFAFTVTEAPGTTSAYSATQAESAVQAAVPEVDLSDTATTERQNPDADSIVQTVVLIIVSALLTLLHVLTRSGA